MCAAARQVARAGEIRVALASEVGQCRLVCNVADEFWKEPSRQHWQTALASGTHQPRSAYSECAVPHVGCSRAGPHLLIIGGACGGALFKSSGERPK